MEDVKNSVVADRIACIPQPSAEESKFEACTHVQMEVDIPSCIIFWDDRKSVEEARGSNLAAVVPDVEVGGGGSGTVKRPRSSGRAWGVLAHIDAGDGGGEGVGGRGEPPLKKKRRRNKI